ncbi:MAG: NnrS family protein, partial [Pseudomonadales bacterium]|nr:NnrS family protein [Pseudomonadales bacterium]
MKIALQEAPAPQPPRLALFELGFRPFFALAGIAAVVQLLLWLTMLQFHWPASAGYYPTLGWHVHEMLFGYAVAVVAGFLLTAVRNWTG